MTPERWQQIERLYHAALECAPEQRSALLDQTCAGDEALRREVESLLASHDAANSFIEAPPDDIAAELFKDKQTNVMLGRTLGHYQLRSLLGAGGMGEVYRARDTRLERDVAVKILPEHLAQDAESLRRFEREAKAVAALSHPNILAIFDFGRENNFSYAVMELLEGGTLRARLKRSALSWREAVEIGVAVAEGLAAAHAKGIIHRDLKPENIFLTADGGVKILDFGIARVKRTVLPDAKTLTVDTTQPGIVLGTLGYMSPEQVRGKEVEAPSDLFSLGCVLYEMVSGQRPFSGETGAEVIAAILKEEPPELSESVKRMPRELARVIKQCLEKRPEQRYQAARELAVALRACLGGSGQQMPQTLRKPMRRAIWVGAALAVLLLGLAAWLYLNKQGQAIDSLAVLPLLNASGDADAEYLSDGITESLINSLSQLPQLKRVIARSSVESYKGKNIEPRKVGQELNVRAVLTGKMIQRGSELIIEAELVNIADGARLWGERYPRKLSDLLALQEEIARHISESLRLKLSSGEQQRLSKRQTTNIEAHQLYLKGRYEMNLGAKESLNKSIAYYNQAIGLDPNFAPAYVGLAESYYLSSNQFLPPQEAMPRSKEAALKAVQIDADLAEAHAVLATVKAFYDWEWGAGERAFKRAIELNPGYALVHNVYGQFLVEQGRFAEAQIEMDRAHELDPLSPYVHVGTAWPTLFARHYDQAIERLRKIIALNPDFPNAYINLGWAYEWKGMNEEAIATLNKALSVERHWAGLSALSFAQAKAGKPEEARKILAQLQEQAKREQVADYAFAIIYAGLGEKDQALAALQKGYENRDEAILLLKVDPFFDSLRQDQHFKDLLRKLNLAP